MSIGPHYSTYSIKIYSRGPDDDTAVKHKADLYGKVLGSCLEASLNTPETCVPVIWASWGCRRMSESRPCWSAVFIFVSWKKEMGEFLKSNRGVAVKASCRCGSHQQALSKGDYITLYNLGGPHLFSWNPMKAKPRFPGESCCSTYNNAADLRPA